MAIYNAKDGKAAGAIYIGRGTVYGNPYRIGPGQNRAQAIAAFRLYLWGRIKADADFRRAVLLLHRRDLLCHCAPLPCHGTVLLNAAAWLEKHWHDFEPTDE